MSADVLLLGRIMLSVRRISTVLVMGVLAACSGGGPAQEGGRTGTNRAPLAFPSGNGDGYCASNPSPECFHGTPVGDKQIVLTFDDGPGSRTSELSSYLKSHGIRATFFVNGQNIGDTSLLSQLENDGHLIGNHTQDHADLTGLGSSAIVSELVQTDDIIAPYVADGHFVFRAPFGSWSATDYSVLSATAMDKYVGPVRWDIGGQTTGSYAADWDCWQNEGWTSKECGDRYLNQIRDVGRGIVLMHDQDYGDSSNHNLTSGVGNTIDMAEYVIETLEAEGYSFLRVDEVPDIAAALGSGGGGCTPSCGGKTCGSDGCGGSCGTCSSGQTCSNGVCTGGGCVPNCTGKTCGGDGCGGSCGTCGSGQTCSNGVCTGGGGTCYTPTFQQTTDANQWWIEYGISDSTVTSASLEVVGRGTVNLSLMWGVWVGPTDQIPTGTQVIVHATNKAGQTAQTVPFGYLSVTSPATQSCGGGGCVPNCTGKTCGTDGCGGSCGTCPSGQTCSAGVCTGGGGGGACFAPTFQQTTDANEWWIEYGISDSTVTSASLEVVGRGTVNLSSMWGVWVGPTDQIPTGTSVIVHATNKAGQTAQTQSFGYLSVQNPPTKPCN